MRVPENVYPCQNTMILSIYIYSDLYFKFYMRGKEIKMPYLNFNILV